MTTPFLNESVLNWVFEKNSQKIKIQHRQHCYKCLKTRKTKKYISEIEMKMSNLTSNSNFPYCDGIGMIDSDTIGVLIRWGSDHRSRYLKEIHLKDDCCKIVRNEIMNMTADDILKYVADY